MINKYRKKPVVITAIQWTGKNVGDIVELAKSNQQNTIDSCYYNHVRFEKTEDEITRDLYIDTLEGELYASVGDYIIKGVNGELYPCKPDIFEKTYELVEEE